MSYYIHHIFLLTDNSTDKAKEEGPQNESCVPDVICPDKFQTEEHENNRFTRRTESEEKANI